MLVVQAFVVALSIKLSSTHEVRDGWALPGNGGITPCQVATIPQRLDEVNTACCGGGSCSNGVPLACSLDCAAAYVPLFDECGDILKAHFDATDGVEDDSAKTQQGFYDRCISNNREPLQDTIELMISQDGCTVDTTNIVAQVN
eukprot:SAG11_NODE_12427_length_704_cov_0.829752_1_plen_144_part_00